VRNRVTRVHSIGTARRSLCGRDGKQNISTNCWRGEEVAPYLDKASSLSSFHKRVRRPISLRGLIYCLN